MLATCGADGLVQLWKDGRREAAYQDHQSRVEAIAVSPNGRWLASVGKDRTLIVRDLRTGALHHRWDRGQGRLSAAAFSPDSRTIAVVEASGETKCLRLFDLATNIEILSREHPDGICSVAFSPNGQRVLTTDNAGVARIWNASRQKLDAEEGPLNSWQAHRCRAYSGVFELDGATVLTAGEDGQVQRWSAGSATHAVALRKSDLAAMTGKTDRDHRFHAIAFPGPGAAIVIASHCGIATLSSNPSDAVGFHERSGGRTWAAAAASPQGNWFLAAGSSPAKATREGKFVPAVVERWESPSGPPRTLYKTRSNCSINDLSCTPAGDLLAIVVNEHPTDHGDKKLRLIDAATGRIRREFPAAADTKARFTSDGRYLIFGVQRTVHRIDLHGDEHRVVDNAHDESQNGLAVSSDGKWLATSDHGRTIKVWSLGALEPQATLQGHQGSISGLAFSSDGRTLLSSSFDGTVKAWNVMTGQHLLDLHRGEEGVQTIAVSADSRRLAVAVANQVRIYLLGNNDR